MNAEIFSISVKADYHPVNQDSMTIGHNYLVIADGMGGESHGELASGLTMRILEERLERVKESCPEKDLEIIIRDAANDADRAIRILCQREPGLRMGSTMVAAVCYGREVKLAWCGDSRAYLYRNGSLFRSPAFIPLSKDHSVVREMIDAGEITDEEGFTHPDNNVITRYIGGGSRLSMPEFNTVRVRKGDILLLCSDGLSGYCRDQELTGIISSCKEIRRLPEILMQYARSRGSDDDITIIAAKMN